MTSRAGLGQRKTLCAQWFHHHLPRLAEILEQREPPVRFAPCHRDYLKQQGYAFKSASTLPAWGAHRHDGQVTENKIVKARPWMGEDTLSAKTNKSRSSAPRLFCMRGGAGGTGKHSRCRRLSADWQAHGMQAGHELHGQLTSTKRLDPRLLVEGARTILSVALNYYPARHSYGKTSTSLPGTPTAKTTTTIMKARLTALQAYISAHSPLPLQSRVFCDTAPVLERYWAYARRARLDRKKHPAHHSACRFLLLFRRNISQCRSRRIRPTVNKPLRKLYPVS